MIDYPCAEFGDFIFNRFVFFIVRHNHTDRITEADDRYTHAIPSAWVNTAGNMKEVIERKNIGLTGADPGFRKWKVYKSCVKQSDASYRRGDQDAEGIKNEKRGRVVEGDGWEGV